MRVLFSEDGPFKFCKDRHESRMVSLLSTAAPAGMFDVDDAGGAKTATESAGEWADLGSSTPGRHPDRRERPGAGRPLA